MNSALEVPVAREDAADHQIGLVNRSRDLLVEGARIADAGRATVAYDVESESREVLTQFGRVVVLGDHATAWGEARLDPGLDRESSGTSVSSD